METLRVTISTQKRIDNMSTERRKVADKFATSYGYAKILINELKAQEMMTHSTMLAHPSMMTLIKIDKDLGACLRTLSNVSNPDDPRVARSVKAVTDHADAIRWEIDRLLENTLPDDGSERIVAALPSSICAECGYVSLRHHETCDLFTDDDSGN